MPKKMLNRVMSERRVIFFKGGERDVFFSDRLAQGCASRSQELFRLKRKLPLAGLKKIHSPEAISEAMNGQEWNVNKIAERKKIAGLTLIEVLVALAIVAIAMTAIIKAASQNIRSTTYLQSKTTAMWVGQNILNEARVGLLPLSSEPIKEVTSTLGRNWYTQVEVEETPNKLIKKIKVSVYDHEDIKEDESSLVTLEGYVYKEGEK